MSRRSDDIDERAAEGACEVSAVDAGVILDVEERMSARRPNQAMSELFSALGDPTRLRILEALSLRELCVRDLAAVVGVSQSGVSHQLRILRQLDLVAFERHGKRAVYRLADDHVRTMLEQGAEHVAERTGDRDE
jgi:DNA-binding transcriptional ArsR family regulator